MLLSPLTRSGILQSADCVTLEHEDSVRDPKDQSPLAQSLRFERGRSSAHDPQDILSQSVVHVPVDAVHDASNIMSSVEFLWYRRQLRCITTSRLPQLMIEVFLNTVRSILSSIASLKYWTNRTLSLSEKGDSPQFLLTFSKLLDSCLLKYVKKISSLISSMLDAIDLSIEVRRFDALKTRCYNLLERPDPNGHNLFPRHWLVSNVTSLFRSSVLKLVLSGIKLVRSLVDLGVDLLPSNISGIGLILSEILPFLTFATQCGKIIRRWIDVTLSTKQLSRWKETLSAIAQIDDNAVEHGHELQRLTLIFNNALLSKVTRERTILIVQAVVLPLALIISASSLLLLFPSLPVLPAVISAATVVRTIQKFRIPLAGLGSWFYPSIPSKGSGIFSWLVMVPFACITQRHLLSARYHRLVLSEGASHLVILALDLYRIAMNVLKFLAQNLSQIVSCVERLVPISTTSTREKLLAYLQRCADLGDERYHDWTKNKLADTRQRMQDLIDNHADGHYFHHELHQIVDRLYELQLDNISPQLRALLFQHYGVSEQDFVNRTLQKRILETIAFTSGTGLAKIYAFRIGVADAAAR